MGALKVWLRRCKLPVQKTLHAPSVRAIEQNRVVAKQGCCKAGLPIVQVCGTQSAVPLRFFVCVRRHGLLGAMA